MLLIDKNHIINYLISIKPNEAFSEYGGGWIDSITHVLHYISNMPTVKAESVKCSECGNTLDMYRVNAGRGDANFCPNCGAKMCGGDHNG